MAVASSNHRDLSDSDIVSDELQHRLIYWRDQFRTGQFEIGDIAASLIRDAASSGQAIPQDRIEQAVGRFCGKSERTIRYYYETAIFYQQETRDRYDVLPFSHFVVARRFDNWAEILDYAMLHPGIPAEALERKAKESEENGSPIQDDPPEIGEGSLDLEGGLDTLYSAIAYLNAAIYSLGEVARIIPNLPPTLAPSGPTTALLADIDHLTRDLTGLMKRVAKAAQPHDQPVP